MDSGTRVPDRIAVTLASSGARIERLRNRVLIVVGLAAVVIVVVLVGGRSLSLDPTRQAVDELSVPPWAATAVNDDTYGSRWCLGECRVRMRTWVSEGTADDTVHEFWLALLEQGWIAAEPSRCLGGDGAEGCYLRDELYLELWVLPVECGDRYELCVGSEVTAVVASQAALPRLAEEYTGS